MAKKMKAIAVTDIKKAEVIECSMPSPGPYELLLRIRATSLCTVEQRTFLGIKNPGFPFIGGHEAVGEVAAVGDKIHNFAVGDPVVFNLVYCGQCNSCKTGKTTQCQNLGYANPPFDFNGSIIGGALAQYMLIPYVNAYKISPEIRPEHAALTEPISCCLHSVNSAGIEMGDTVVIIGCGIMGTCHIQLCKLRGARVIVSEPMAQRREKALKNGADLVIDPISTDPVEYIRTVTGGLGADVVFNTTPITDVWHQAIEMLAPQGRLMAYSSQHPDVPVPLSFGRLHSKEYEIKGVVNPGAKEFVQVIKLMQYGMLNLDELIDSVYDFDDCQAAFERASQPEAFRVIIRQAD